MLVKTSQCPLPVLLNTHVVVGEVRSLNGLPEQAIAITHVFAGQFAANTDLEICLTGSV